MKLKKILSICLVGALAATLLTACGSSDETVGEEIKEDVETVAEDVKDVAEEAAEDVKDVAEDVGEGVEDAVLDVGEDVKEAAEEAVEDVKENAGGGTSFEGFDETITINVLSCAFMGAAGVDEVVDAINEISVPAINVAIDYTFLEAGAYVEQVGLALAGGDAYDLIQMIALEGANFTSLQSHNGLIDISGYLEDYGQDILDLLGDFISGMQIGDAIYGVPCYRLYNSDTYIIMRKDILDELGLTEQAANIQTWSDYEDIMLAVQAAQDELPEDMQTTAMICNSTADDYVLGDGGFNFGPESFADCYAFENLGDGYRMIMVDDDGNVVDYFATEDFKDQCERLHRWYEEGLVYKDAATSDQDGDSLMAFNNSFSYVIISEYGVEQAKGKIIGHDLLCINIIPSMITTDFVQNWGWGVSVNANNPEAAVAFLDLMYTNADIENLMVWGIEGRDYELNDEGEAVLLEDGVYVSCDWMYGNQFLAYPSEGQGSNFRAEALQNMEDAEISPYLGCIVELGPIENELTAVSNALSQYFSGLTTGTLDPDGTIDDFLSALDSAGMQIVIDHYQETLDEWLAEQ